MVLLTVDQHTYFIRNSDFAWLGMTSIFKTGIKILSQIINNQC